MIALLVFSRSEIFLLKAFHKEAALAVFALAFGISQQLTAPADAMLHALLPAVAGVLSAWPERAAAAFDRATRVSALACGGLTVAVVPLLVFLVPVIYGSGFQTAAWLLIPLALVSCFQSVNNPVTAFANARRRAALILGANAAALVVDVAVAVALIPPFGAWGAVVANTAGQLVALGAVASSEPLLRSRRREALTSTYRPFLASVAIVAATLPLGVVVRDWSPAGAALVASAVGSVAYVTVLRLWRCGLTTGDRDAVAAVVSERSRSRVIRLLSPVTVASRPT
jgi:O-antigen/teichoic acid export membrane protein